MAEIKVFSYNILTDGGGDGPTCFKKRGGVMKACFPKYEADIIGFQETMPWVREWLIQNFPEYEICGLGRGADLQGESNLIAFRRDRFDLVSLDQFWLSDTPRVPGSRFHSDQSGCPRICMAAMLREKESGKCFRYYNTHLDHRGEIARAQGMTMILNRMAEDYAVMPLPVILTGDLNAEPGSAACRSLEEFKGCGAPITDASAQAGMTFHDFKKDWEGMKIDYVYTNLPYDPASAVLADDEVDGLTLSDHYPVGAVLEL